MTHILTPVGKKLECCVCGNVYWANDPTASNSENPLAPPPLTEQERWTRFRQSDGSREGRIAAVKRGERIAGKYEVTQTHQPETEAGCTHSKMASIEVVADDTVLECRGCGRQFLVSTRDREDKNVTIHL